MREEPLTDPAALAEMLTRPDEAAAILVFQERHVAMTVETFLGLTHLLRTEGWSEVAGVPEAIDLLWTQPEALVDLAATPLFTWWTSILGELLGVISPAPNTDLSRWLDGADRRVALQEHLRDLLLFAAAAAVRAGISFAPGTPLRAPAWLPGTEVEYLDATGEVGIGRLEEVRHGVARWEGATTPAPVPEAKHGGLRLTVHAHHRAFLARHIERWDRIPGRQERCRFAGALGDALALAVGASPELDAIGPVVTHCTPMTTRGSLAMASGAYTRLQGAVFVAASDVPIHLAEMFMHELSHTRLSLVEREHALFADGRRERRHYSPWRDDPRPAEGVLHALFVHSRILRLWAHHVRAGTSGVPELTALRRIRTLVTQLQVGATDLRRSAVATPFGAALLAAISTEVEAEASVWPELCDERPFFSELKGDDRLHQRPISQAVLHHRAGVMGGVA